jgi:adenylylsulfate kinase-like enzyme
MSAPYEEPFTPELVLDTERLSIDESVVTLLNELSKSGITA